MIDRIIITLGVWADKMLTPCLAIIIFTALWDCIKQGFTGYLEYSVGAVGITVIVACSILLYASGKAKDLMGG